MIGTTWENKHNGRISTITKSEITDNGIVLYTCEDGIYLTDWDLKNHWFEVSEEE